MAFETINLGTQPAGTGGDTARSAFEKTNRNFLAVDVLSAAMSQAQFEAIRAQNNEEFAASGSVHLGNHESGKQVNECKPGLYTALTTSNTLLIGKTGGVGGSKTDNAVLNMAGVLFHLPVGFGIKFSQAPDGKTTYNKSTGVITNHATVTAAFNAQAADQTNVEVVTDRVDMWGFEAWLEEVSTTNPHIYPNGIPQSQAATMDGIATSASARPVTYYAVFDGDTTSKGKGLNFFSLTDAQKKKVLANPKNNLYYLDDGRLVQWRLRQRTISGLGNGDFSSIDAVGGGYLDYATSPTLHVRPQGARNTQISNIGSGYPLYGQEKSGAPYPFKGLGTGIFGAVGTVGGVADVNSAVNGECYFLVCGTVNRLNQGAYHPSFNPSGSKMFWKDSGGASSPWYLVPTVQNTARCFDMSKSWNSPDNAGYPRPDSGNIGALAGTGRSDGRLYDAIYADGQGGVCRDMRYSAYGVSEIDFSEADQRVKNGTYRGFELVRLCGAEVTVSSVGDGAGNYVNAGRINFKSGEFIYTSPYNTKNLDGLNNILIDKSTGNLYKLGAWLNEYHLRLFKWTGATWVAADLAATVVNAMKFAYYSYSAFYTGLPMTNFMWSGINSASQAGYVFTGILYGETAKISVGGSFLQTDVIGNPANIIATPQLANGWQGSWIPVIPDGTSKPLPFTKKYLGGNWYRTFTTDNGGTWVSQSNQSFDVANNTHTSALVSNGVMICQYQAFAKQTENSANTVVYGGRVGIGDVFATSDYLNGENKGVLLRESLINKVRGVPAYTNGPIQIVKLTQATLSSDKLISGRATYNPSHPAILIDGNASIDAVKALNYNVNLNQQAFIQYAYTELKHNGTNWGDDGKVTIVDNQTTKTDLNGNSVLVGTAKLKEPIGWIKNKV